MAISYALEYAGKVELTPFSKFTNLENTDKEIFLSDWAKLPADERRKWRIDSIDAILKGISFFSEETVSLSIDEVKVADLTKSETQSYEMGLRFVA